MSSRLCALRIWLLLLVRLTCECNSPHLRSTSEAIDNLRDEHALLISIERALDWGNSGDSCLGCARLRVVAALEAFFDHMSGECDGTAWDGVLEDTTQNCCPKHATSR
jgi:hypothetical protein